jgi:hypothetical protein
MERKITDINDSSSVIRTTTKITMSANSRQFRVVVLVESPNNEKLFKPFFTNNCYFYSTNGWSLLIDILNFFNNSKNIFVVLGIIDADFHRIENKKMLIDNLFLTDFHDTEMMIIFSKSWNNFIIRVSDEDKIKAIEVPNRKQVKCLIIDLIRPLAILRLLNERENIGLMFKTKNQKTGDFNYIDYDFIDLKAFQVNMEQLLKTVENKSQKQNYFRNNPEIKTKYNQLLRENFDLRELSNGHDFINVLAIVLNKKYTSKELEDFLIYSYHSTDFEQTALYKSLFNWQSKNPDISLLK